MAAAQEIRHENWGESLDLANGSTYLGSVDWNQGNLAATEEYWLEALRIRRKLAPQSYVLSISLFNLGILASARGNLEQAADYLQQALSIITQIEPDGLNAASYMQGLGDLAFRRADLERAKDYYTKALGIQQKLAPNDPLVAESFHSLANLAFERDRLEQASDNYHSALKIYRNTSSGSPSVASILNGLGNVELRRGTLDKAKEHYQSALRILQGLMPYSIEISNCLNNLGDVSAAEGDFSQAAEYYGQALEIRQHLAPGSSPEAESAYSLGIAYRRQNQPESALTYFRQALGALERQVSKLGGSRDLQAGFRAQHGKYYRETVELLVELNRPEEALHTFEQSLAQSFLGDLTERDIVFTDIPERLDSARRRIAVQYDRLQQQLADLSPAESSEQTDVLLNRLRQLRDERQDLIAEIRKTSPKLAALQYPEPLDLPAIQEILDPGTVMLSYSVGEQSTQLFVVNHKGLIQAPSLPISEEKLTDHINRFRILTHEREWTFRAASRTELGRSLFDILIQPAEGALQQSARVLIIPDGPLHLLPFAALVRGGSLEKTGDEGGPQRGWHYLVEWKPIHSVLSATVYAELGKLRPTARDHGGAPSIRLAAFGDALYPGQNEIDEHNDVYVRFAANRGDDLGPLPFTRREVEGIAELYPQDTIQLYLGAEATEERVKSLGRNTDILHFATHGEADDRFPLNSYVALTIPDVMTEGRDNGLLQAWEIFERFRIDADLVVLSACDSGRGKELPGEGLYGLTRAFQYAGARTVAATLWKVADQATAELMIRFYRHLRADKPKDRALQAAQTELIRGPIQVRGEAGDIVEMDTSAPYYWAAFQLIGDWQ